MIESVAHASVHDYYPPNSTGHIESSFDDELIQLGFTNQFLLYAHAG